MSEFLSDSVVLGRFPRMTAWYNPAALMLTGATAEASRYLLSHVDPRDVHALYDRRWEADLSDPRPNFDVYAIGSDEADVCLDFIADTGDGFWSTYAVLSTLAQTRSERGGTSAALPKSRALLVGGDAAYPYGSPRSYRDRFVAPLLAASSHAAEDDRKQLFAIPGNHDWYNGISAFDRVFCGRRLEPRRVPALKCWDLPQTRTYFVLTLPHAWELWCVDTGGGAVVNSAQIDYFLRHAANRTQQKQIIIVLHEPLWLLQGQAGGAWSKVPGLDIVIETARRCGSVRAFIAGDIHNYSRFTDEEDTHYIVAGGGGAYLAATHDTPARLEIGEADPGGPAGTRHLRIAQGPNGDALYPSRTTSRWMAFAALWFPIKNWQFACTVGAVYALVAYLIHGIVRAYEIPVDRVPKLDWTNIKRFGASAFDLWVYLSMHLLQATLISLVYVPFLIAFVVAHVWYFGLGGGVKWRARLLGAMYGCLHVLAVMWCMAQAPPVDAGLGKFGRDFAAFVATGHYVSVFVAGAIVGSYIWALNIAVTAIRGRGNVDRAYSALGLTCARNFLRLQVNKDGITVHPVGIRRTPQWRWSWRRGRSGEPTYVPRRPLKVELIEPSFLISSHQR